MNDLDLLRRNFTAALLQTGRLWRRFTDQVLVAHNISEASAAPLLWIGRLGGGIRQVALASYVGIEGPSLVRLLDQLEASGLVVRKDDPTDRRAKTLWLTEDGERFAARLEELLVEHRARILADVAKEDLEAALRVLQAFADAAAAGSVQPAEAETEASS
ncbi:MarR family winged helix-turn-helix transcriptional regulator [Chelatococcus sp. GCM10030263]|uniref:MarR family winged helix-turn-helix transcriptional regulator n=1 Tax=Chelatococcus sp. GCM10030263 TaxID=3273387 RepID=UPI00360E7B04